MKKISVWHKNHHLQQVTEDEGTAMHSFSSHVEKTNDLSQLSLSPAFWLKSLWSVNVKWREIKNSCQAVDVILGKWEVEENSWISSSSSIFFFFFFWSVPFFPWLCFGLIYFSQLIFSQVRVSEHKLRSWQVMTFRCRSLWGSVTERRWLERKKKLT